MDSNLVIVLAVVAIAAVAIAAVLLRGRGRAEARHADLAGRLAQMSHDQRATQAQSDKTLDERLGGLKERLAVIDRAQQNITKLSSQVVGLQDILSNKQARGAFGEIQLSALVGDALPSSAYDLQATLPTGRRVDCLLKHPYPPGPIAIDAKFPLESYHALRQAKDDRENELALRAFGNDIMTHVRDIAERYIVPGETAELALMFLPSEAVFAEMHARLPDVVQKSYRSGVYIVSPTTMMALLNTIRAVMRDVQMREQAGLIQIEVQKMLEDVIRLDDRVGKLQQHFAQATDDVHKIRISTEKISGRADRIKDVRLGEDEALAEAAAPARLEADGG